jgi:hypothetical protein
MSFNPFLTVRPHFFFPDRNNLFQPVNPVKGSDKKIGIVLISPGWIFTLPIREKLR